MTIYCLCWSADPGQTKSRYFKSKDDALKQQAILLSAYKTIGISNFAPIITELTLE